MAKDVIKKKGFKQASSKKHVKTRTPYKAVEEYEKEFKYAYAEMIGDTANALLKMASKQLNVKGVVIKKSDDTNALIDNVEHDHNCNDHQCI